MSATLPIPALSTINRDLGQIELINESELQVSMRKKIIFEVSNVTLIILIHLRLL